MQETAGSKDQKQSYLLKIKETVTQKQADWADASTKAEIKTGLQSKLNCKTGGNLNILIWPKEMCHNNILLYIVSKGKVIFSVWKKGQLDQIQRQRTVYQRAGRVNLDGEGWCWRLPIINNFGAKI